MKMQNVEINDTILNLDQKKNDTILNRVNGNILMPTTYLASSIYFIYLYLYDICSIYL